MRNIRLSGFVHIIKNIGILVVTANLVFGCDSIQLSGVSSRTQDNSQEMDIDEPVSVSGSFLVCAPDSNSPYQGALSLGCRVESTSGDKLDLDPKPEMISIQRTHSEGVEQITPHVNLKNEFWHWTVPLVGALSSYTIVNISIPDLKPGPAKILTEHARRPQGENQEPDQQAITRIMFISSQFYRPAGDAANQFTSLDEADDACQALASTSNLQGSYAAILSDQTISARDRLNITGQVIDVAGNQLAGPGQFWMTHDREVLRDESGNTITGNFLVWTGTEPDGNASEDTCASWGNPQADATTGQANDMAAWVSGEIAANCNENHRIYCISMP